MTAKPDPVFLFHYRFEGQDWPMHLPAKDAADAKRRLKALPWARLDGTFGVNIPATPEAGLWVRLIVWGRNAVARRGAIHDGERR